MDVDKIIRGKLHVKGDESLPYIGWAKNVSRHGLAELFNELGYKVGAEIGVRKAQFTQVLCEKIPGLKIYCVDTWEPYRYGGVTQERQDLYLDEVKKVLQPYNHIIMKTTSMEAVKQIQDNELDFVYIDALHDFDNVMLDIIHWSRKVKPGGIVSGHDFGFNPSLGIVKAVTAYTQAHNIQSWYITHKLEHGEGFPSWFWVRK